MIEAGEKAPEFTLPDQDGKEVSLSDLAGRTLVLYFYPKADTLDPQHVALVAASYLSRAPNEVMQELTAITE